MKAILLIQNENLAIAIKENRNLLIIYPPRKIPVAIVGKLMTPKIKEKLQLISMVTEWSLHMKQCST